MVKIPKGYKDGDWVVHTTASLFSCEKVMILRDDVFPFSYWDDYDPSNYRLATKNELENK